jgi:hypothetical protein
MFSRNAATIFPSYTTPVGVKRETAWFPHDMSNARLPLKPLLDINKYVRVPT